jgi:opacity protein-like surface antigen
MRTKTSAMALAAALLVAPAVMAQTTPQPGTGGTPPTTAPGMNPPPATTAPGTAAPGSATPRTAAPGTAAPGTAAPDMAAPGTTPRGTTAAPGTATPAPRTDTTPTTTTPAAGANSFTEGQARSRIEGAGYTDVQNLKKDDQGVWRGQAMRNGARADVGLDFQGNVVIGNAPAAPR